MKIFSSTNWAAACRTALTAVGVLFFPGLPFAAQGAALMSTSADYTFYFGVQEDRAGSIRLDGEHVDLNITYFGGAGEPRLGVDEISEDGESASAVFYSPDEAHIYLNENTKQGPAAQGTIDAGYGFIGIEEGDYFWRLNQNTVPGTVYLGISADEEDPYDELDPEEVQLVAWNPGDASRGADFEAKFLRLDLISVEGPEGGEFSLFHISTGSFFVYMATSDGIDENDCFYTTEGGHDHLNWTFNKTGVYAITFRVTTATRETYENWLWTTGLSGTDAEGFAERATPAATPNGVRYALGLSGSAADTDLLPHASFAEDTPAFDVELPDPARPDITYEIWRTYDLTAGTWSEVATKTGSSDWSAGVETLDSSGAHTLYRWSEADTPAPGQAVFYQLRLTQQ